MSQTFHPTLCNKMQEWSACTRTHWERRENGIIALTPQQRKINPHSGRQINVASQQASPSPHTH